MNHKMRGVILGLLGLLLTSAPTFAHHSFTAEFDAKKVIELTGVVSKIDWINPHVYVYLDVKDDSGKITTWSLESHPTGFMHLGGIKKDMLGQGQTVKVLAYAAKDGSKNLGYLKRMTFSDGHYLQLYLDGGDPTN